MCPNPFWTAEQQEVARELAALELYCKPPTECPTAGPEYAARREGWIAALNAVAAVMPLRVKSAREAERSHLAGQAGPEVRGLVDALEGTARHERDKTRAALLAAFAQQAERLREAEQDLTRAESQRDVGYKIRRYVAFVLTGDEESDVQVAAERVMEQLAHQAQATRDAEQRAERATCATCKGRGTTFSPDEPDTVVGCPDCGKLTQERCGCGKPRGHDGECTPGEPFQKLRESRPQLAYLWFFADLVTVARQHGYALAVHGSACRDLDLVAIPWVADPNKPHDLAEAIRAACGAVFPHGDPVAKPHGRLCWSIVIGGGAFFDFSVMPPSGEPFGMEDEEL